MPRRTRRPLGHTTRACDSPSRAPLASLISQYNSTDYGLKAAQIECVLLQGRAQEAYAEAQAVTIAAPNVAKGWYVEAAALEKLGQLREAHERYQRGASVAATSSGNDPAVAQVRAEAAATAAGLRSSSVCGGVKRVRMSCHLLRLLVSRLCWVSLPPPTVGVIPAAMFGGRGGAAAQVGPRLSGRPSFAVCRRRAPRRVQPLKLEGLRLRQPSLQPQ